MKKLLILSILLIAIPLFAATRTQVMVWVPCTGVDSLLSDSINKQIREIDALLGQISVSNDVGNWIGLITADTVILKDTVDLKVLASVTFPNVSCEITSEETL